MVRARPAILITSAALVLLVPLSALGALADQPGADLEDLLARVPDSHRDLCRADVDHDDADAVMAVRCELSSGITVYYTRLPSAEALLERYEDVVWDRVGLDDLAQDCSSTLPSEQAYTVDGEPAGDLLCYASDDYVRFVWADRRANVFAQALDDIDLEAMWTWWLNDAGPIEPAVAPALTGAGAALDVLLERVPDGHRASCRPFYGGGPEEGVVVSLRCEATPELTVYYDQYDSLDSLTADYASGLASAGIEPDSGDCAEALEAEQGYTIDGESAGRVSCTDFLGGPRLRWTHEPSLIGGTLSSDLDLPATWEWWLTESGPTP
jgi:hypothetical protein